MTFTEWSEVCPLADLLVRSAARFPDRNALVMPDFAMTYTELRDASIEIARGIIGMGLRPRAHVGILANNSREMVAALFGAALANCVAVPLNARHKSRELGYIIENADLALILTTAADTRFVDFREVLSSALPSLGASLGGGTLSLAEAPQLRGIVVLEGEAPAGFLSRDAFAEAAAKVSASTVDQARRATRLRDTALIIYTSGTTANPKGCLLTHEAVTRGPVERASSRFRACDHDVTWGGGPLFHIGSFAPFIGAIGTGGTYVTDVFFDAGRALDLMERERVTVAWPWFPAILQPLLDHPEFAPQRLAALRKVLLIAPPALVDRAQRTFPEAEFMQACGMTETAGIFALCAPDETPEQRTISQGKPVPGIEVKIVDLDSGTEAAPGAVGEILVRGYCVMEGYHRSPEKTAEALDSEGWLHTGDLYARGADGQLTFHGRAKDMLKVGGENVAAIEVEAYICSHPAVKLAEVVGRPDPRLDEVPVAFVELRPGHTATAQELIDFCQGRIASYKVPRAVFFMNDGEWPMSATKVDKRALRTRL
ncbi:class I adenylate-forming enzyme family protein [Novosphingobium sp. CECT 9465]|uniref:class I adenylate-forming enzyme family protein n=1 Tax=Novosphingobium sp. CECT 9465 TaxID=2829794 RepID=UPI001E3A447E|nr:class I adenylate-forming enzyme family protein [Novosphingobium sp. CECT 9465]CAH0496156.1 3-[(3aS,4S,7aS)-7a-methyl-1, 5-dioxo-octahydro-1H-inden-4-yl]propanoyl:CoA ligase [Novosphingobium sp. CECT 9465]